MERPSSSVLDSLGESTPASGSGQEKKKKEKEKKRKRRKQRKKVTGRSGEQIEYRSYAELSSVTTKERRKKKKKDPHEERKNASGFPANASSIQLTR